MRTTIFRLIFALSMASAAASAEIHDGVVPRRSFQSTGGRTGNPAAPAGTGQWKRLFLSRPNRAVLLSLCSEHTNPSAIGLEKMAALYEMDTRVLQPLGTHQDPASRQVLALAIRLADEILRTEGNHLIVGKAVDRRITDILAAAAKVQEGVNPPVLKEVELLSWLKTSVGDRVKREYLLRTCPRELLSTRPYSHFRSRTNQYDLAGQLSGHEALISDDPRKHFEIFSAAAMPRQCWITTASQMGVDLWVKNFPPDQWDKVSDFLTLPNSVSGGGDFAQCMRQAKDIRDLGGPELIQELVRGKASLNYLILKWVAGLDVPLPDLLQLAKLLSRSEPDSARDQEFSKILASIISKAFPKSPAGAIPEDKRLIRILHDWQEPHLFSTAYASWEGSTTVGRQVHSWKSFADDAFAILPEAAVHELIAGRSSLREREMLNKRYAVFKFGLQPGDFARLLRDSRLGKLDFVPLTEALAQDLKLGFPEKEIDTYPYSEVGRKVMDISETPRKGQSPKVSATEKPNFPLWIGRGYLLGMLADPKMQKHLSPTTVSYYRDIEEFLFPRR